MADRMLTRFDGYVLTMGLIAYGIYVNVVHRTVVRRYNLNLETPPDAQQAHSELNATFRD
ncbi:hypothetical protein NX722_25920 [Endozoicomonas gorgoniicola]|uniref:Uncharacterized protein n=1 Tax=Endozoicomonas gorgoniicola TaxID=1234144 RepID=A0ABT3N467_9GAMM|nr:hypothetical protein [Endozoicomonas gorgoniicola]MCW7556004.1 hypothetical protein [Endozoicomonas gorgoniicola]